MINDLSDWLAAGATLIVDDQLAAAQLEAYLHSSSPAGQPRAWPTPPILTRAAWAARLWAEEADDPRLLLSPGQSMALWRSIVTQSDDLGGLFHIGHIAAWAEAAWKRLLEWQLDYTVLRARTEDLGFASFLGWADRYEKILNAEGWIDTARLETTLAALYRNGAIKTRHAIVSADLRQPTPSFEALLATMRDSGCEVAAWQPADVSRSVSSVGLRDGREELCAAMAWADRKVDLDPHLRIALVVPRNAETELLLQRGHAPAGEELSAEESSTRAAFLDGRSAEQDPIIGAAMACLELFSQQADFETLSRCLRSPFLGVGSEGPPERARIEAALRREPMAQLDFLTAYRVGSLKGWLAARAPQLGERVDGLLRQLETIPRRQSPTHWLRFLQRVLAELGWPGSGVEIPAAAIEAWSRALAEFSQLTAVLGSIDYERALRELRAILSRATFPPSVPLEGISIVPSPEQVGPGYDAVWVVGMSDRAWPRQARPNPLLPHALQAVHKMPFATPADSLDRCREITATLVARVPELIFSYPQIENDYASAPSPLLRDIVSLDPATVVRPWTGYFRDREKVLLEQIEDPVPPLAEHRVPGGATTLALQSRCPLRAFIDARLLARPIDEIQRGIDARKRGLLTHRALELLLSTVKSRADLSALGTSELERRITDSIRRALYETLGFPVAALRSYARLEQDRLTALIEALVSADLQRGDFEIVALEIKQTASIADLEVGARIDRIDRLHDGRLAIIDYKTGQRASPSDWLQGRLLEPQLPLYLQLIAEQGGAIMFCALQAQGVSYKGLSDTVDAFPGRAQRLPAGVDWSAQRCRWAEQLTDLVTEFAAGDGRIFVDEYQEAAGAYAPLTRVYSELLAFREETAEAPT